jgi:hypothetical protein
MFTFLRQMRRPSRSSTAAIPRRSAGQRWNRLLLVVFLAPLFNACNVDPEDKAFFYRGWIHPETDAEQQRRLEEGGQHPPPNYKADPLIDG